MGLSAIDIVAPTASISQCYLVGNQAQGSKASSDAFLLDADGNIAMAIRGIETFVIPTS